MSFASRYNKKKFNINTTGFEYFALGGLYDMGGKDYVYTVRGLYINEKSKFGAAPVVATDSMFVNLPSHMLNDINNILNDPEAVEAINAGNVGMTIYEYESHNRKCYGVEWVDV